ncbi:MAG: tetratricopeptide repeat protein [Sandaracinaceae bacterium]|nr:tetratricopeptide repeat protein [Sandaracinaceae bacterium]
MGSRTRGRVTVLAFAVAALATSAAAAQDQDARVTEARGAFEQAEEHFEAGRFAEAARRYERSYELLREAGRPTAPLVLFNIGSAYDRAGQVERAREAYARFVEEAPRDLPDILQRIAEAEQRLAALSPAAAEPTRDAPDARDATPREAAAAPSGSSGPDLTGPLVLFGVAGASLVVLAIGGGLAIGENDRLGESCGATGECTDAQLGDLRAFTAVADVGWITAALAGAVAIGWLVAALASGDERPAASLTPWITPHAGGVALAGVWGDR